MSVLFRKLLESSSMLRNARRLVRTNRMRAMLELVSPPSKARVIDLGGTWEIWDLVDHDFDVTLVNTSPWPRPPRRLGERYRVVVADACNLRHHFEKDGFDLAFSNSAIEHMGGRSRRKRFAGEIRRLAPSYWIQTPNPLFPIEAHTGFPFYWQWPDWAKARSERTRRRRMPAWHEEMLLTDPVYQDELDEMFPDGETYRERMTGLVKSFARYKRFHS